MCCLMWVAWRERGDNADKGAQTFTSIGRLTEGDELCCEIPVAACLL